MALKRAGFVQPVQDNLLIWADSAGWTGWEVLMSDEWKMALVTVLCCFWKLKCGDLSLVFLALVLYFTEMLHSVIPEENGKGDSAG